MTDGQEFYNQPLPTYGQTPQYQIPVPEDHHFKREYTKIDFENKSFAYLKKKLEKLEIPKEKIDDLIEELEIIINNAGKLKITPPIIRWFLDDFDKLWDNYCIYVMKNSRWIDELNHVREYAMFVLVQELFKSIDGWQGDNILRSHQIIEQSHAYNVRQEAVSTKPKRRWGRKQPTEPGPAIQGYNLQQQGGMQR